EAPVVHVRRGESHVAQGRDLEGALVGGAAARLRAAPVLLLTGQVGDADDLEVRIGEGREPMALEAARLERAEEDEAAPLRRPERGRVAEAVAVEGRGVRDER